MHHENMKQASAGDNIGVNTINLSAKDVKRGYVIGDPNNQPPQRVI